jgi:predicted DNA-binding transcriptional regulator AlpA
VPRRLVKAQVVAERLGMSKSWVTQAARDGRLPAVYLPAPHGAPASVRFDLGEVEAWVEQCRATWTPGDTSAATLRRVAG